MAATPQPVSITLYNPQSRQKISRSAINVDITTNLWTFEDGGTVLNVPAGFTKIIDMQSAAAVVDCRTSFIRVNNVNLPRIILNNTLLGTAIGRPFQQVPLDIPSGATLSFACLT